MTTARTGAAAALVGAELIGSGVADEAPLLRREIVLDDGHGGVVGATWTQSAHGLIETHLNGSPAHTEVLAPGWSSYEHRLRYRTHDVTDQVRAAARDGRLVLGVRLGRGWWAGRLGWFGDRALYGDVLGAIGELIIDHADGHRQVVTTDGTWRAGPSYIIADDLYDGQHLDARRIPDGWLEQGFDDSGWRAAVVLPFDHGRLVPALTPPIVRYEEIAPQAVWTSPSGRTLVDFGVNLVGWIRCRVTAPAGTTITLRHAEVLRDGELDVTSLRTAKATDTVVCSGGEDVFEPTFTTHGFRYAEATGWPGTPGVDDLTAVVVMSQLERTGTFSCSDELLNRFHANVVRGLQGNVVGVPTDCPQRDERLGYTGDLAVFAPTAAFLFDTADFVRDWLRDLRQEQLAADGVVPFFVPDVRKYFPPDPVPLEATAVWGDAAVWVPWTMWMAHGDRAALAEAYPAMVDHVHRVASLLSPNGLWDTGFQFGDWLDPRAPADVGAHGRADHGVVATACAYRTAVLAARTAAVLGQDEDEAGFIALAGRLRWAFTTEYVGDDGRIRSDCPTVYALAIAFGLLDEPVRGRAGDRLAALVREAGFASGTGFVGTPFVCDALVATGHSDEALGLLMHPECPSWLYPVTQGATTVWERWDGIGPDGAPHESTMNSFNHYAFGAVADFVHRHVGGLTAVEPGYRRVRIAPHPGGGITHADTSLRIAAGTIRVGWRLVADEGSLEVELPAGTVGEVVVPGGDGILITGPTRWSGTWRTG